MSKNKKILYVVSRLIDGGPTNQLYNLVRGISPYDWTPEIITLNDPNASSQLKKFSDLGVSVKFMRTSRWTSFFNAGLRLKYLVRESNANLIHSQGIRPDLFVSRLSTAIPKISTVRNYPQIDYAMTYGIPLGSIMTKFHIKSLQKFSHCVGVSESVTGNLLSFGIKASTVQNGVDCVKFYPRTDEDKLRLRVNLGLPSKATIFICIGHLSERKNPLEIISSFVSRFGNSQDHFLVVLGSGPLEAKCRGAASSSANVRFTGYCSEVSEYLGASDIFLSASLSEGMPNAALEAVASGLRLVLSNIPPHKELGTIAPNQVIFFDSGCLSDAMDIIFSFGPPGNHTFRADHEKASSELMVSEYHKLYSRLVENSWQDE